MYSYPPPVRPRRRSMASHASAIAFVWGAAIAITLLVASQTKIGPVVLMVSRTHGVHLGDVLTGMAMGGVALVASIVILADRLIRR